MNARLSAPALRLTPETRPNAGIVHLGLGAFFRAHGVSYLNQIQEQTGNKWGIIGVSLMRSTQRDRLAPQNFIYTAVEQSSDGPIYRHYDDVVDVLVAAENPSAVIAAMADPKITMVTMTVTEKGYYLDPATGRLNLAHPDIAHDRANVETPRTAIGYLVAALVRRKTRGYRPFTVVSCDNLPSNGALLHNAVVSFAKALEQDLADWIQAEVRFPGTMIDRIVPATTQEDIDIVKAATGYQDFSPVVHEPFTQWVIEDDFVDGIRPPLEKAGVQFVDEVAPFETMKLRCLNGSHSSLAYLGFLIGHQTIYDSVSDSLLSEFIERLWSLEIVPTLKVIDGVNYSDYCQALMKRFSNPAIEHKTAQIAIDGSQKLPQRLLATLSDNIDAKRPAPLVLSAIASWIFFVSRRNEQGELIQVNDALAAEIADRLNEAEITPEAIVDALLGMEQVFPSTLREDSGIRAALIATYEQFTTLGIRESLSRRLEKVVNNANK